MRTTWATEVPPRTSPPNPIDNRWWGIFVDLILLPLTEGWAIFLAAFPALHAYRVADDTAVLAGAAFASTLISVAVARWWRRPASWSYVLSLAGLVALLVVSGGIHPEEMLRQFVQGPNRLVTETLPLSGPRTILTALVVATWVCGAASAELTARLPAVRPAALAGVVFPLGLFVLTYSVASAAPHRDVVAGPLLFVTLALLAVIRRYQAESATTLVADAWVDGSPVSANPGLRHMLVGVLAAGLLTGSLVLIVPALPGMANSPATIHRSPTLSPSIVVDPVDAMAEFRDSQPAASARNVMSVKLSRETTGYLGMGVLDDYDGATWRFDTTFIPTGGRVPLLSGGNQSVDLSSTVTQRFDVEAGLPIPFLPALDRPVEISGLTAEVDPVTGMILPFRASSGGYRYVVTSQAASVSVGRIPPADGVYTAAGPANLELPPDSVTALTASLKFLAGLTGERPAPTVAFIQAAVDALHAKERRIDPTIAGVDGATSSATSAPPTTPPAPTTSVKPASSPKAGHGKKKSSSKRPGPVATTTTTVPPVNNFGGTSLSEVIQAVTVDRAATPEQFATFLAMVARDLGVPARVVTGFRLVASSEGETLAPGSYQVTNRQAWTWVEIPVAGVGWVAVDPSPDGATGVVEPPPEQVQAPATTLPPRQANAVPKSEIAGAHALAHRANITIRRAHHLSNWIWALVALAGAIGLLVLVGPVQAGVRRYWRRRSRQSADPALRAIGAWLEMLDGLSCAGMRPSPGLTNSEIAAEAGIHFGPEVADPLAEVGQMAERAIFSSGEWSDPAASDRAWLLRRNVLASLRQGMDRRQRLRSKLLVGDGPRRPSGSSVR